MKSLNIVVTVIGLTFALLSVGCATYQQNVVTNIVGPAGSVRIEFERASRFVGGGVLAEVFDTGQIFSGNILLPNSQSPELSVGRLKAGTVIRWDRAPGLCTIRTVMESPLFKNQPKGPGVARFVAFSGETYHFRFDMVSLKEGFVVVPVDAKTEALVKRGRKLVEAAEEDRSMANAARLQTFEALWKAFQPRLVPGISFAEIETLLRIPELLPGTDTLIHVLLENTKMLHERSGIAATAEADLAGMGELVFSADSTLTEIRATIK